MPRKEFIAAETSEHRERRLARRRAQEAGARALQRAENPSATRRKYRDPEDAKAAKRERGRAWRAAHPDKIAEYKKRHLAKNPQARLAAARAWKLKNKERVRAYNREWERRSGRQKNKPGYHRRWHSYNLTAAQFEQMVIKQAGRCAICNREARLQIDHCHVSERVRALLCGGCNSGLGHFHDDQDSLRRAIEYLKKFAVVHLMA